MSMMMEPRSREQHSGPKEFMMKVEIAAKGV
jgi:hypothetical protein